MPYSVSKNPDGDLSLGNQNGEYVTLQPSISDYSSGGYALIDDNQVVNNSALAANVDLYKILAVIPIGGQGGYVPVWNPTTKKVQIRQQNGSTGQLSEVPANTDLSAQSFQLLLMGL